MAVQTTYNERMELPRAGTVTMDKKVDTGICETVAGIGFGLAVGQGTGDKGVVLGGALAIFRGMSVRDVTLFDAVTPDEYQQYQNVGVLTDGKAWVVPFEAVAAGDVVHYNATTGRFGKAGGSGPILGARWVTSAAANAPAQLELSGYNQQ